MARWSFSRYSVNLIRIKTVIFHTMTSINASNQSKWQPIQKKFHPWWSLLMLVTKDIWHSHNSSKFSVQACQTSLYTLRKMIAITPIWIQQRKSILRIDWNRIRCKIQSKRFERDSNQMLIPNWWLQHGSAPSQALVAPSSTSSKVMAYQDTSLKQIDLEAQKTVDSQLLFKNKERKASSKHHTRLA